MTSLIESTRTYFPSMLSHLWSSTLFLLLILLIAFALRGRLTAGGRFSLALIGIVKFAVPGRLLMSGLRRLSGEPLQVGSEGALEFPLHVVGGTFALYREAGSESTWPLIFAGIWIAVALALMLRFTLTRRRLVALAVRTAFPPDPREVAALARARARLGIRRSIDIARSPAAEAPAVLRTLRPIVVLPVQGCDDLSEDELESLLRHECAHVARHDNLVARIESLICAAFWFHPLIWIAHRIMATERERACDEIVADSTDNRETYLTALSKFCQATIAPRLPGVSCMASAKLKERMDHVMNYPTIKAHSPSPARVTLLAASALVLFTLASGLLPAGQLFASSTEATAYAVKVTATRVEGVVTLHGVVTENATGKVLAVPKLTLGNDLTGTARSGVEGAGGDVDEVVFRVRPDEDSQLAVDVTIEQNGRIVQSNAFRITPSADPAPAQQYSGAPMRLSLENADIRDVIMTFGQLTGMEMKIDDSVQGRVSVNWVNVPWDQALDDMLKENGLKYEIHGSALHVSKK